MTRPILIAALLLAAHAARAQPAVEVEITDWGLSSSRIIGHSPAPGTSAGYSVRIDGGDGPLERTDTIDACPGTQFGIKYRLKNAKSPFATEDLEIEWAHPPFRLADGRVTTTDRFPATAMTIPSLNGWFFEETYELVPGEWIVSVQRDGQTLAQHRFMVRVVRNCARQMS